MFLNSKEKSTISLVKLNPSLTAADKKEMIENIQHNARMRSDGFRKPVRSFLAALSDFKTENIINQLTTKSCQ